MQGSMAAVSDLIFLGIACCGLLSVFFIVFYLSGFFHVKEKEEGAEEEPLEGQRRRRGGLDGLRRRRGQVDDDDEEDGDDANEPKTKKQLLKEQKKKERAELRKFDEVQREERKKKGDSKEAAYKSKMQDRQDFEDQQEAQKEEIKANEKVKQQKEFEEWKNMFSVEEEGNKMDDITDESQNLLQEFIEYIQTHKVVVLEDVAAKFNMPTQEVVRRVEALMANDRLSGIIDDRGKFIYITPDELQRVATLIQKKGRVSIAALSHESNRLIRLQPDKKIEVEET